MDRSTPDAFIGWLGIIRLGLVQTALGAVVVLTTSTLNRVMVVELMLPAVLPGLLVALHYLVQVSRPRMGHGSDVGGRRSPWILGGLATLAVGGVLAAVATVGLATHRGPALALAVFAFILIGLGVSACGTSLLALLAKRVHPQRRPAAATVVWLMMIFGFALTAGVCGRLLDPYSPERLLQVSAAVSTLAILVASVALIGVEPRSSVAAVARSETPQAGPSAVGPDFASAPAVVGFRSALREVWAEPAARQFTFFVFLSMLAYSSQDLILEPFAGLVFGFSPGESTALSGVQHGGVLVGMILVAVLGSVGPRAWRSLEAWCVGGCLASAAALAALSWAALAGPPWPLRAAVFAMGAANGAFSIAAIASMMRLAGEGRAQREGTRVGLWGAAQAIAFGFGGLAGAAASDVARWALADERVAYAVVFGAEALLFVGSALLAMRLARLTSRIRLTQTDPNAAAEHRAPTPTHPAEPVAILEGQPT